MKLYKYIGVDHLKRNLDTFLQGHVYLSSVFNFNDPYDSMLRISSSKDHEIYIAIEKYLGGIIGEDIGLLLAKECQSIVHGNVPPFTEVIYESIDGSIEELCKLIKYLKEHVSDCPELDTFLATISGLGVACFSLQNNGMQMWAHYASNHKGLCLEFEVDEKKLEQDLILKKVEYVSLFAEPIRANGNALNKNEVINQITSKHVNWQYENEVRLFSMSGKVYQCVKFPGKLTAICLGKNFSWKEIKVKKENQGFGKLESIYDYIDREKHEVEFNDASLNMKEYCLVWKKI